MVSGKTGHIRLIYWWTPRQVTQGEQECGRQERRHKGKIIAGSEAGAQLRIHISHNGIMRETERSEKDQSNGGSARSDHIDY